MHTDDWTWYLKQIVKATYDCNWPETKRLYDTVAEVWGETYRFEIGRAVRDLV